MAHIRPKASCTPGLLVVLISLALTGCAANPEPATTLYEDLGGEQGIDALVNELIVEIAADDRIRHHFRGLHIGGFRNRLATHFCQITDGPCTFEGRSMRESHRLLDISRADFNALVEDIIDAMETLGIQHGIQNRFLARLAPMQPDIVSD